MRLLKGLIIAAIISAILFILFLNNMYYANVMNYSLLAGMTAGVLIAVISSNITKRALGSAFLAGVLLLLCSSITIPNLTYDQASELVQNEFPGQLDESNSAQIVSITNGEFTFLMPRSFYLFSLEHGEDIRKYMVNPNTGKIVILN